ncbi:MAG: LLM class flavin-dependent oxidoreductase [Ilumatobacteraceae bacterium]
MTATVVRRGVDIAPYGELADPGLLGDLAVHAEEAGYDGVFIWDHLGRLPAKRLDAVDTTVALTVIAERTQRVRFGALVTPLTRRRPQKFARETVSLDHLSGGRLIVGVGLGVDHSLELSGFGDSNEVKVMAERLDEALEVVAALWSGREVHHRGAHFVAEGVTFTPVPVQQRIPVWVGANTARTGPMRRAARWDGVVPNCDVDEAARMMSAIEARRGSLDGFDLVAMVRPGSPMQPWRELGATWIVDAFAEQTTEAEVRAVIADADLR